MAIKQYNRLRFDRNQDRLTRTYRVWRATDTNVTRNSVHVMDITDPGRPNPIGIKAETLKQMTTLQYQTKHKNLLDSSATYPTIIYINGVEATQMGYYYKVDKKNGYVKFVKPLPTGATLTINYYFDGIEVVDSVNIQTGVAFFGPMALDNSVPNAPVQVAISGDNVTNQVILRWQSGGFTGSTYYYRVDAIDEKGDYSQLCSSQSAYMSTGYDIRGYVIERSIDGITWEIIGRTDELMYRDPGTDKTAPYAPMNVTASVVPNKGLSTAVVTLKWINPNGDPVKQTGKYRVRVISSTGQWSDPSGPIGPIYIETDIAQVVIRRKPFFPDGRFPSYAGPDAQTVIAFTDPSVATFLDAVSDNTVWAYSIYRVDVGGNYSQAGTAIATVGNATPPPKITSITAKTVDLIY